MSVYAAAKSVGLSYHACHDAENTKAPRNYITAQSTLGELVPAEVPLMTLCLKKPKLLSTISKYLLCVTSELFYNRGKLKQLNE